MAIVKSEMKSFIWLQTPDELIQQVEEEVAMFCPMICEVHRTGMGSSKNYAIKLPKQVTSAILGLILDYCRFHQVPGRSNKERKTFDEKFIRLDSNKLCELISAADSLKLRPLVELTASALARMIEGKTAEQIREREEEMLQEEKFEPLKIRTNDPRVSLLNRLYARKRKELKARKNLKNVEVEEERVDETLLFINSGNEDSKGVKPTKNKKKNRRRKNHPKEPSSDTKNGNHKNGNHKKETDSLSSSHNSEIEDCDSPTKLLKMLRADFDFPEDDFDDDLDPALMEELDMEVDEFARKLNSVCPERVQEIIPFGPEICARSRMIVPDFLRGINELEARLVAAEGDFLRGRNELEARLVAAEGDFLRGRIELEARLVAAEGDFLRGRNELEARLVAAEGDFLRGRNELEARLVAAEGDFLRGRNELEARLVAAEGDFLRGRNELEARLVAAEGDVWKWKIYLVLSWMLFLIVYALG